MRKTFLLYLFVFSLVVIVIQYVNAKKMMTSAEERIALLEKTMVDLEESNDSLSMENENTRYFSLLDNEEAMSYFEERGIEAAEVAALLESEIRSRNNVEADNNLVPYKGMEGFMRINKMEILNHKWVLADFTDGKYWGEVFIAYDLGDDGNLHLQTEKAFLYPVN